MKQTWIYLFIYLLILAKN